MKDLELMVTLWPTFPHFERFAKDYRLSGIRLNSAMINGAELDTELDVANKIPDTVPLWFDVKGRQLRVKEVFRYPDRLELTLNHPIKVRTPTQVLFKAGADGALLKKVVNKTHLVFEGGPYYNVFEGESLHIRDPSLQVSGAIFCDYEIEKIMKAKKAGFKKFFISYVEDQKAIDQFESYVGKDCEIGLKIENKKGLEFVANNYQKKPNHYLMAARGDLYVEVDRPHHIMDALKLIIEKDEEAYVGSRFLLSLVQKKIPTWVKKKYPECTDRLESIPEWQEKQVPECADFTDIAWLYDIGYKKMMLCDELCLQEHLLARAVNAFDSFRQLYSKEKPEDTPIWHEPAEFAEILSKEF